MSSDNELLDNIIATGTLDPALWPALLPTLTARLQASCSAFPPPPADIDLTPTIASLQQTLSSFASSPPYTLQRLCELLTQPGKHYTSLSKYLRALERVLSVTSGLDAFPLQHGGGGAGGAQENGVIVNGLTPANGLGSDESLGGALLTRIPWLKEEDANAEDEEQGERMMGVGEVGVVDLGKQPEGGPKVEGVEVGESKVGESGPGQNTGADEAMGDVEVKADATEVVKTGDQEGARDGEGEQTAASGETADAGAMDTSADDAPDKSGEAAKDGDAKAE